MFCFVDKNLAVFRGEDGVAYVVDAYCPHLGANMSVLGKVIRNCLQCPFHGWTFRGEDGVCVDIPYSTSTNTTCQFHSDLQLEIHHYFY